MMAAAVSVVSVKAAVGPLRRTVRPTMPAAVTVPAPTVVSAVMVAVVLDEAARPAISDVVVVADCGLLMPMATRSRPVSVVTLMAPGIEGVGMCVSPMRAGYT